MKSVPQLFTIILVTAALMFAGFAFTELTDRLASLEERLVSLEQSPRQTTTVISQPVANVPTLTTPIQPISAPAAKPRPSIPAELPAERPPTDVVAAITQPLLERGYLYEHEWETLSPKMAQMTPEENQAFWEEMNEALANGSIEVYAD